MSEIDRDIPRHYGMRDFDRVEVVTAEGEVLRVQCAEPVMVQTHSGHLKGYEKVLRLEVNTDGRCEG